ncbi:MAG: hypothetical protein R2731_17905 [Nocardioides sp.]
MARDLEYDIGSPGLVVVVQRGQQVLARELCESEEEAAAVAAAWAEQPGVSVKVEDLADEHGPDDILAPELPSLEEGGDGGEGEA